MADSGSKTEKATPKKRKDERKKGNVFSSKDIANVVSIIAVFGVLKLMFPSIYGRFELFFEKYINYVADASEVSQTMAMDIAMDCIQIFCYTVLPILFVSVLATVVATGGQTRFMFAHEALKPKFNRLNPLQGFKKMFSMRSAVEVVKGILKIIVISAIGFNFVESRMTQFARTAFMGLKQGIAFVLESTVDLVFNICIIFVFIAALDFMYQRWDYERQLKMTKHEVKEEYKQLEGDPQIKSRIKETQRKFAMSRMMQAVPTADVIIKNPTHFAVALKYDMETNNAPVVVAKGQDQVALRIIAIGEEHGVYITEDRMLARALYAGVEINREIPLEYYNAVAEILALLYRMKNKKI